MPRIRAVMAGIILLKHSMQFACLVIELHDDAVEREDCEHVQEWLKHSTIK